MAIASDADNLAQMAEIRTTSLAAFEAYSWSQTILDTIEGYKTPDGLERASGHLQDAMAADPHFAKAAATLSWFVAPGARWAHLPDPPIATGKWRRLRD